MHPAGHGTAEENLVAPLNILQKWFTHLDRNIHQSLVQKGLIVPRRDLHLKIGKSEYLQENPSIRRLDLLRARASKLIGKNKSDLALL